MDSGQEDSGRRRFSLMAAQIAVGSARLRSCAAAVLVGDSGFRGDPNVGRLCLGPAGFNKTLVANPALEKTVCGRLRFGVSRFGPCGCSQMFYPATQFGPGRFVA